MLRQAMLSELRNWLALISNHNPRCEMAAIGSLAAGQVLGLDGSKQTVR